MLGIVYLDDLSKDLTAEGIVTDISEDIVRGRQLQRNITNSDNFDLSDFLKFEV